MAETIQMRTTQEKSGNYRVFAGPTIDSTTLVQGLAVIQSAVERLGNPEYVEVEFEAEPSEGDTPIVPDKWTGATARYKTEGPAIRHVYLDPKLLEEFGFEEPDGDMDSQSASEALPESIGVTLRPSSADAYEQAKEAVKEEIANNAAEEVSGLVAGIGDNNSDEEGDLVEE